MPWSDWSWTHLTANVEIVLKYISLLWVILVSVFCFGEQFDEGEGFLELFVDSESGDYVLRELTILTNL